MSSYNPQRLPVVGDEIVITKSSQNWSSTMDQFGGLKCVITKVSISRIAYPEEIRHAVTLKHSPLLDERINYYIWVYENDHFLIVSSKKTLRLRMSFKK